MDPATASVLIAAIAAISSLGAAWIAAQALRASKETHAAVNSRMTELLALAKSASRAEGVIEGKAEGGSSPP